MAMATYQGPYKKKQRMPLPSFADLSEAIPAPDKKEQENQARKQKTDRALGEGG